MSIKTIFAALVAIAALAACDEKDADERFIAIGGPTAPADTTDSTAAKVWTKNVLIEDFTGQKCTNCPEVHRLIEQLTTNEAFGQRLVPVAIHAGQFGIGETTAGAAKLGWLMQPEGNEYADKVGIPSYPKCVVDRQTGPIDLGAISAAVAQQLAKTATAGIELKATIDGGNVRIAADIEAAQPTGAQLQLWIIESGITAYQLDNGKSVMKYVHNHVFRAAANGTWGESVGIDPTTPLHIERTIAIKDYWNTDNISVVAILYTDGGVLQTKQTKTE